MAWTREYLHAIGVPVPQAAPGEEQRRHQVSAEDVLDGERSKERQANSSALNHAEFQEAYASALTKFDCLGTYFQRGMAVAEVGGMIVDEVAKDIPAAAVRKQLHSLVCARVGKEYAHWKQTAGLGRVVPAGAWKPTSNPLPWASIAAYPEWVLNVVGEHLDVATQAVQLLQLAWLVYRPHRTSVQRRLTFCTRVAQWRHRRTRGRGRTRQALEEALLQRPLTTVSVKYDGTCFGKLDDGTLLGRNHTACSGTYLHTSTAAADAANVQAFRAALQQLLGMDLGRVAVYGELICNAGYYGYAEEGLAEQWLCFGAILALDAEANCQALSAALQSHQLAYSIGEGKIRLFLCQALRRLLTDVAGCKVVEEPRGVLTHAELIAGYAEALKAGKYEGLVVVIPGSDGQVSVRKWKNSAEGGGVASRHAAALAACEARARLWAAGGLLDERILGMLAGLREVAEADTQPVKRTARRTRDAVEDGLHDVAEAEASP